MTGREETHEDFWNEQGLGEQFMAQFEEYVGANPEGGRPPYWERDIYNERGEGPYGAIHPRGQAHD